VKVTIFGLGYVGLVTGACLAEMGNQVLCVDIDERKVEDLQKGIVPIYEPGLQELLKKNLKAGNIEFGTDLKQAVKYGDCLFIAVGTPSKEDGSADLSYVMSVANTIGQYLDHYAVVVNKSTVPIGTADRVKAEVGKVLSERGAELEFGIVSNPEFLKEGAAVQDFMKPDRIIIGSENERATGVLKELYLPFNRNRDRVLVMDTRSAELTKYAANAMLATKISFMNEMANIAESAGADVEYVRLGIGSDPRIGFQFIYPGIGYGGSCFPKDVRALMSTGYDFGYESMLLHSVDEINKKQKDKLFNKIYDYFSGCLEGKTIAIWGLAFKPNTDDMREAPSRVLMEALWEAGASVRAYDPQAMDETRSLYGERDDLTLVDGANEALYGADVLVLMTEWNQFWSPDFKVIKDSLRSPVVFDGRNIFNPVVVESYGLAYYGIGRGASIAVPNT